MFVRDYTIPTVLCCVKQAMRVSLSFSVYQLCHSSPPISPSPIKSTKLHFHQSYISPPPLPPPPPIQLIQNQFRLRHLHILLAVGQIFFFPKPNNTKRRKTLKKFESIPLSFSRSRKYIFIILIVLIFSICIYILVVQKYIYILLELN